jgi:hypothetical protein
MPRLPEFPALLSRLFRNRDNSFHESAVYPPRLTVYIHPVAAVFVLQRIAQVNLETAKPKTPQ